MGVMLLCATTEGSVVQGFRRRILMTPGSGYSKQIKSLSTPASQYKTTAVNC